MFHGDPVLRKNRAIGLNHRFRRVEGNHAAVREPRRQTFPSFRNTADQFTQRSPTSFGRPGPVRILPPSLGGSRVIRLNEQDRESRDYSTQKRMSTFRFAIEGETNFSACGAICIGRTSFTTCTDECSRSVTARFRV